MIQKLLRFRIRSILFAVFFVALFVNFVIAPELQRVSDFSTMKAEGAIIYAPPVVLFGGQPPFRDAPIPKPYWFSVRQQVASLLGVETLPWISEGSLEVPSDPSNELMAIINFHGDFRELAARRGLLRGFGGGVEMPILDFDMIELPDTPNDPNDNSRGSSNTARP